MYYDVEKIKEELLPIQVIEYLGVPYERHGKNIFIYCPEHEERTGSVDRHIGNCILNDTFQRAYYCFGCGASGDAFRLIAMLEHLDPKHDFRKILAIAYEACGGGSYFLQSPRQARQRQQKANAAAGTGAGAGGTLSDQRTVCSNRLTRGSVYFQVFRSV